MLLGLFLSTVGAHEAAKETIMVVDLPPLLTVEVDQVLGLVFSMVGIASLIGGIALCYVGFRLQRISVACIVLGSCGLAAPSMILGMGYSLTAGIAAIVIGYPWLATLLLWLMGGERQ